MATALQESKSLQDRIGALQIQLAAANEEQRQHVFNLPLPESRLFKPNFKLDSFSSSNNYGMCNRFVSMNIKISHKSRRRCIAINLYYNCFICIN